MISILGDKNAGYELGAFEYFVKPISADKLLSAFNRLEQFAIKRIQKIVIVDDDELEFEKFKREFKMIKFLSNILRTVNLHLIKFLKFNLI